MSTCHYLRSQDGKGVTDFLTLQFSINIRQINYLKLYPFKRNKPCFTEVLAASTALKNSIKVATIRDLRWVYSRLLTIEYTVCILTFLGSPKELGKNMNIIHSNFASLKKDLKFLGQLRAVQRFSTLKMIFSGVTTLVLRLVKKPEL